MLNPHTSCGAPGSRVQRHIPPASVGQLCQAASPQRPLEGKGELGVNLDGVELKRWEEPKFQDEGLQGFRAKWGS